MTTPLLADRGWLVRRYQTERRPVAAIAEEARVDPSTVWRALRRHGIELRGRVGTLRLSDESVRQALVSHPSVAAAARTLGVAPGSLYDRARLLGFGRVERCGPADLAERYAAGRSAAALAADVGVSVRTVRRWLAFRGVGLRPPGRPGGAGSGEGRVGEERADGRS